MIPEEWIANTSEGARLKDSDSNASFVRLHNLARSTLVHSLWVSLALALLHSLLDTFKLLEADSCTYLQGWFLWSMCCMCCSMCRSMCCDRGPSHVCDIPDAIAFRTWWPSLSTFVRRLPPTPRSAAERCSRNVAISFSCMRHAVLDLIATNDPVDDLTNVTKGPEIVERCRASRASDRFSFPQALYSIHKVSSRLLGALRGCF